MESTTHQENVKSVLKNRLLKAYFWLSAVINSRESIFSIFLFQKTPQNSTKIKIASRIVYLDWNMSFNEKMD